MGACCAHGLGNKKLARFFVTLLLLETGSSRVRSREVVRLLQLKMAPGGSKWIVVPGERLHAVADGYSAGDGCYEIFGFVHSALVGKVLETRKTLQVRSFPLPISGRTAKK